MSTPPTGRHAPWATAVVFAMCVASNLHGEEAPATKPDAAPAAKEAPKPDDQEKVLREQSIYIPYEKLRKTFEKEGRGVFLPYEKFRELWDAAQQKLHAPADQKPPRGSIITEIESEATVAKDVVKVVAVLKIDLLAEGWNEVPLRLGDAAITRATLDGQPARITNDAAGYKLLVEKKGKEPKQIVLGLEYARSITRSPGQNSVAFEAPQAPVNRWRVRIPEAGVKLNIHPMIAAPEMPAEPAPKPAEAPKPEAAPKAAEPAPKPQAAEKKPDETALQAYVGAAPTVRIEWTPKAEGATGLAALASVQAQQQVAIGEGVVRTRIELAYTVSRAELGRLVIEAPADHKIVNVFDPNVRQWSVKPLKPEDKTQQIEVQLFEPAKTAQTVVLELEKFTGDAPKTAIDVPVVKAVDAARQQGVVVVQVGQGLRAEASSVRDLLQVDAGRESRDLPERLRAGQWAFAYRYATVPYELKLDVEKVQPRILTDSLVEAYLEPDKLALDVLTIFTIERAGAFKLELDVPAGFDVLRVEGRAAAGAAAAAVDSHHLTGETKTRLVVSLAQRALGKVGLVVSLEKHLDLPDLRTPTDKSARIPLALPRVAPGVAEVANGRLLVYAPESLRVNAGEAAGLRSVPLEEPLKGMEPVRQQKPPEARPVLAFAYVQAPEPTTVTLDAQRRKPQVTVAQLLVAGVEEGVVKYNATLYYNVRYSSVKGLRIDVPAAVAGKLHVDGATEEVVEQPASKPAEGYVAWNLKAGREFFGQGKIGLSWEEPLPKLEIAKPVSIAIPRLKPVEVDRAPGKIVLKKAETFDVHEQGEPKGLRPIDPQLDLKDADMPDAQVAGAARAFAFDDDWSLSVEVTRFQLEELKRTSVERAAVRMVVTRAGRVPVQALYRMKSQRQRLAVTLPDQAEFDTQPLRINGQRVSLESGDKSKNEYFVPLVDPKGDTPFVLELRYTVPAPERDVRLDLPQFPEEPAVQKVYVCLYTPKEWAPLAFGGPWTEEFSWRLDETLHWRPQLTWSDQRAVSWVAEGIAVQGDPLRSFETDGQQWVFSTLAPQAAPEGSLSLRTVERMPLDAVALAVVLLGGLVLLPARAGLRAVAVGALLVGLVICGVFASTLAAQLCDGELGAALFAVLVVWTVWHFVRRRPLPGAAPSVPGPAGPSDEPAPPADNPFSSPPQGPEAGGPPGAPERVRPIFEDEPSPGRPPEGGDEGGRDQGGPSHA